MVVCIQIDKRKHDRDRKTVEDFLIVSVKAFTGNDYVRQRRLDFIENIKVNLMRVFKGSTCDTEG